MANIITHEDHKYKHYNRSLGCKVESKAHYEYLMKKKGLIPQEKADDIARRHKEAKENIKLELSKESREIIEHAKSKADKHGNVKLEGRAIEALKKIGVGIQHPQTPKGHKEKGGFR